MLGVTHEAESTGYRHPVLEAVTDADRILTFRRSVRASQSDSRCRSSADLIATRNTDDGVTAPYSDPLMGCVSGSVLAQRCGVGSRCRPSAATVTNPYNHRPEPACSTWPALGQHARGAGDGDP